MIRLAACLLVLLLAACSSAPYTSGGGGNSGRYHQRHDAAPTHPVDIRSLKAPVPKIEPKSRYGNPASYSVRGKTYHVLKSAKGYDRSGYASWYGTKFQGFRTSSGERYDMYKFTAANKVLPLPTYVRVTNLDNGRKLVVRVNDRGPFHPGRIIDLSWAAAKRLGVLAQGTAHVRVQSIVPGQPPAAHKQSAPHAAKRAVNTHPASNKSSASDATQTAAGLFLQVGAFSNKPAATHLQRRIRATGKLPASRIVHRDNLYRVWLGPFKSTRERRQIRASLKGQGYPSFPKGHVY